jgi:hypothetical protein
MHKLLTDVFSNRIHRYFWGHLILFAKTPLSFSIGCIETACWYSIENFQHSRIHWQKCTYCNYVMSWIGIVHQHQIHLWVFSEQLGRPTAWIKECKISLHSPIWSNGAKNWYKVEVEIFGTLLGSYYCFR